jgi:hypothetical protein
MRIAVRSESLACLAGFRRLVAERLAVSAQLSWMQLGRLARGWPEAAFFSLCRHCTIRVSVVVWVSVPEVPVTVTV